GELVGREGIEPPQPKAADLQSAELTTCSTYPRGNAPGNCGRTWWSQRTCSVGADDGTRTRNRRFTKPLLYQLSYVRAQGHTAERPEAPANDRAGRRKGQARSEGSDEAPGTGGPPGRRSSAAAGAADDFRVRGRFAGLGSTSSAGAAAGASGAPTADAESG